jgi:hypothetical protein
MTWSHACRNDANASEPVGVPPRTLNSTSYFISCIMARDSITNDTLRVDILWRYKGIHIHVQVQGGAS